MIWKGLTWVGRNGLICCFERTGEKSQRPPRPRGEGFCRRGREASGYRPLTRWQHTTQHGTSAKSSASSWKSRQGLGQRGRRETNPSWTRPPGPPGLDDLSYFVLKCLKAVMEKWGCMDRGLAVSHFEYYISKTLFHHKISSCFSQIRHIDSLHLTFLLVQRVGGKQQGQEQLLKKKLPLCSAVLWTWLHAAHLAAAL